MEPSNEAKAAAERLIQVRQEQTRGGSALFSIALCDDSDFQARFEDGAAQQVYEELRHKIAIVLDDHTAALRAEVERLRARALRGGWYRSDQTLPPFNVRVRLWARFLEDGKLSRGEESHGTRIAVFKSEGWAREWIWDTPDGTTDESEDYGRRYTHWQYITPPEGE